MATALLVATIISSLLGLKDELMSNNPHPRVVSSEKEARHPSETEHVDGS